MQYSVIYRNKDKGIQVIVQYKDKLGKWRQKSKQGFTKKALAKEEAQKIIDELKENFDYDVDLEDMTFGDFKKEYLEFIRIHRELATYDNYTQALAYFDLDDEIMSELTLRDVQKKIDENTLTKEGELKYSATTFKRRVSILRSFIKWVSQNHEVKTPNLDKLVVPKGKSPIEKTALNVVEKEKVVEFYKNNLNRSTDYYVAVLLSAYCGLRIGEICGLTWEDIDLKKRSLVVNKQWKQNKITKKWGFGDLKSKNSYRKVPFKNSVKKELSMLKKILPKTERLIQSESTRSLTVNLDRSLQRHFNISLHELRHTFITNLLSNGLDFKTTAAISGHDVEETIRSYSHVTDDMLDKAKNLLDKIR